MRVMTKRLEASVNSKCLYVESFRQTVNSENTDSFNNNDLRGKNNPSKPRPPDKYLVQLNLHLSRLLVSRETSNLNGENRR